MKHFFLSCLTFLLISPLFGQVNVSTATGRRINYDHESGMAIITGDAVIHSSTATLKADEIQIDTKDKKGEAFGNVKIIQGTTTITGDKAIYYWRSSTGVFYGGEGFYPPWHFFGHTIVMEGRDIYHLESGGITSCDHDPPHYRIKSTRSKVVRNKRATLKNARLLLGDLPSFWSPVYTRSLVPRKYIFRLEPGQSSRDGITNRTIWGYPFTENSFTKVKWDYLQYTGNGVGLEHRYFNPRIRGNIDSYLVRDTNPDPVPDSRRFTILWDHFQKITSRLSMNARLDVKSDQSFGNEFSSAGNRIRVENSERGIFSEGGFRYQFPRATLQVQADRRDRFDSTVSSGNFISKLTLPRVTFNTIPLKWKFFPFYTSFSGNWTNETLTRSDPKQALRYQRSADLGVQIKKDFRIRKKMTVTPRAGYSQAWQDHDTAKPTSEGDIYNGRYNAGYDIRRRFGRILDVTVGQNYVARMEQNRFNDDLKADDHGVETNAVNLSFVSRIGRSSRLSMRSGYDLRSAPRNLPTKYSHTSERILSPSFDIQWQVKPRINVFFRETYSLFDSDNNKPVRTPANTSGEIQFGEYASTTFFSQGFSYTKGASGADSLLHLTNKLKFFLTSKWHLDIFLSYRAVGPNKINYKKALPIEKTIHLVRDLHCWVLRATFSDRTGIREASFHIDLKTDLKTQPKLYREDKDNPFYTYRDVIDENSDPFNSDEAKFSNEDSDIDETKDQGQ
ncbi:hypothetical protein BVX98_04405 [bacterium F11]|nr:hypothetical protein BVX98_04405 [bacterium F11]